MASGNLRQHPTGLRLASARPAGAAYGHRGSAQGRRGPSSRPHSHAGRNSRGPEALRFSPEARRRHVNCSAIAEPNWLQARNTGTHAFFSLGFWPWPKQPQASQPVAERQSAVNCSSMERQDWQGARGTPGIARVLLRITLYTHLTASPNDKHHSRPKQPWSGHETWPQQA